MKRTHSIPVFAILLGVLLGMSSPRAHAGWTDTIKKKVGDKVQQQAAKGMPRPEKTETPAANADAEKAGAAEPSDGSSGGSVSTVSTKFDYVPGDSVMFLDDFRQDELGEFPAKWRLVDGNFEVAEMKGERWLRCVSNDGHIRMKTPSVLPEFWTLEFDLYGVDLAGAIALTLGTRSASGGTVWEAMYPFSGTSLGFRCGDIFSSTVLEGSQATGRHHIMCMGRGTALKVYVDRERMANVPDVTGPGVPAEFDFRLWAASHPMIGNVRFAEGCRPAKDMLAQGRLVTYGIQFETGSDVVKPESAPVLRQVASYLDANGAVKLRITGHTDNVGTPATNLDLSKRRAASVASVLSSQFGIGADRFEAEGSGDTKPVSSNAKPEGRAMNRRVEFAKL